ncbi:Nitrogen assimilation transcription factor nit-4 [Paramyrothecium foliicola]|nr:Nitrogen assimilation transcription factor nit-4 [Paramyrothecium foliicola]
MVTTSPVTCKTDPGSSPGDKPVTQEQSVDSTVEVNTTPLDMGEEEAQHMGFSEQLNSEPCDLRSPEELIYPNGSESRQEVVVNALLMNPDTALPTTEKTTPAETFPSETLRAETSLAQTPPMETPMVDYVPNQTHPFISINRIDVQSRLQTNRELEAANEDLRNVVGSLKEGTINDSINVLQRLRAGQNTNNAPGPRSVPAVNGVAVSISSSPPNSANGRSGLPLSQWTRVSNDDEAMLDLLNMLWTWDTTLTKIIHRGVLHEHVCSTTSEEGDSGSHGELQFCSRFLINALLAVATTAKLYANTNEGEREPTQLLGRTFAEEAVNILSTDRHQPTLALLQGIAALWMYNHLSGKSQIAGQLLDELFSLHSHLETKGLWHSQPVPISSSADNNARSTTENKRERQALSYASWGLYFLDLCVKTTPTEQKICLGFHSNTHILRPCHPVDFGSDAWHAVGDSSVNLWIPYPITSQPRFSYFTEAYASEAQLSLLGGAIILEVVQNATSPAPDYRLARQLYDRISGLRRALPSGPTAEQPSNPMLVSLGLVGERLTRPKTSSITADVLALRLLEPFVNFSFLDFDRGRPARSLVALHCESILSTLWNYRTAFGMRHDGWHLQACSTAAHMLMSYLSPARSDGDISTKSCMLLHAMGQHMPLANQSLLSLRTITERREINLPRAAKAHLTAGCLKTNSAVVLSKVNIVSDADSGQIGGSLVLQQGTLSFTETIGRISAESAGVPVLVPATDNDDSTTPKQAGEWEQWKSRNRPRTEEMIGKGARRVSAASHWLSCDGVYPVCAACKKARKECTYAKSDNPRSSSSSSSGSNGGENGEALVEAIRLLNALPPQRALAMIRVLQSENNSSAILSRLWSVVIDLTSPSADLAASPGPSPRLNLTIELQIRHPFTYPPAPYIDLGDTQGPLKWLTQATRSANLLQSDVGPSFSLDTVDDTIRPETTPPNQDPINLDSTIFQPSLPLSSLDLGSRLQALKISYWTDVSITNELAIQVLCLYFDTDHALIGSFEPDTFVHDLVTQTKGPYCSSLMVNALMFWACQMYSAMDDGVDKLVDDFAAEAERLWASEGRSLRLTDIIAAQYMSLSYQARGIDHAVLRYLSQAVDLGTSMGLFGVEQETAQSRMGPLSPALVRTTSYSAWGIFNWATFMAIFYHQPGVEYPKVPPTVPVPESTKVLEFTPDGINPLRPSPQTRQYRLFFPVLCGFWRILNSVAAAYYVNSTSPSPGPATLDFAKSKYEELLEWTDNLPSDMSRNGRETHLVITFHLWLHSAILDIFRPFTHGSGKAAAAPKDFSSGIRSPEVISAASINQLKRLIVIYRFNYKPSTYSMVWHTALLYLANAMLRNTHQKDWFLYFILCLYGYESLCKSFRVTEAIGKGLLSMAMRNGSLSGEHARRIMAEFQERKLWNHLKEEIRATCMVDLDLAMSDPTAATAEILAGDFDDNAMIQDYTRIFEIP